MCCHLTCLEHTEKDNLEFRDGEIQRREVYIYYHFDKDLKPDSRPRPSGLAMILLYVTGSLWAQWVSSGCWF